MKTLVPLDAPTARLHVPRHVRQGRVDGDQVVLGPPLGSKRGELHFERSTGLEYLRKAVAARPERRDDPPLTGVLDEEGTVTMAHADDAEYLEGDKGLRHRRPAHPQPRGEFAFRR